MDPRASTAKRRLSLWTNVFPRHAQKVLSHAADQTPKSGLRRRLQSFRRDLTRQSFSDQQKKALNAFSSVNYQPTHSISFLRWLGEQKNRFYSRFELDRWFLVLIMGIVIGLIAVLLKQSITALGNLQWTQTKRYLKEGETALGFWFAVGVNVAYVVVSSFLVTFIHPPAAGGGTPEVVAFLNGIIVHGTLSLKNLVVKFIANVFAVASGLPCAIQAPVITYGAIVGAGIGQFQSRTLGIKPDSFKRFRNAADRREFTTAGVAAGVSAGFNAPVGGLLFAMEDISSFWTKTLSWQTFFCGVIAAIVAQVFNAAFVGFVYQGQFGSFNLGLVEPIAMHLATLVPALLLGLIGGLMAAFFSRFNTFLNRQRKMFYSRISNLVLQRMAKMLEAMILVLLMTVYSVYLPLGFKCTEVGANVTFTYSTSGCYSHNFTNPNTYNCPTVASNSSVYFYNPMAQLIQGSGTAYLDKLWLRGTYFAFDWYICLAAFAIYFPMTVITAGSAIAGGIFVPVLVSGSLYGRALGVLMLYIWQSVTGNTQPPPTWQWMDPGVMAAIGAASLLGGVNRLATASTVIVMEMVGDISLVIPNLISIFIAKMVADQLSKPLFKCMLEGKALPFLDQDPKVLVAGKHLNMELCRASDIMSSPVSTIHSKETVATLAKLLLSCGHSGFPVVKHDDETKMEVAYGLLTRIELYIILCSDDVYKQETPGSVVHPVIPYADLSVDYIGDKTAAEERIRTYARFNIYSNIYVDLEPFINISTPKVDKDYSLYRTYVIFRTLGLRHLVVVDINNRVVGIITRKDLMQFRMQERLESLLAKTHAIHSNNNNNNNNHVGNNNIISSSTNGSTMFTKDGLGESTAIATVDCPVIVYSGSPPDDVDPLQTKICLDNVEEEDEEGLSRTNSSSTDDDIEPTKGSGKVERNNSVAAAVGVVVSPASVADNDSRSATVDKHPLQLVVSPTMGRPGFDTPL